MASVINTNMASLYAQKNLSGAQNALSTSVERLSSGLRINRAKDDAAGLGISEKIKSQVTSLNQGARNANDAISMVQTAEGSLSEVSSILQRMKELSVQARNESLSTVQRSFISDELVALKNEINAISERTTFNDMSLLKNALRTQVSVPALADATKLVNGATVLDGISVSGLSVQNTNVGSYSVSFGTSAAIANQVSEASGKFGGSEVDTITIAGTWADTETVTATIQIEDGATITATYTVSAANGDISAGTATGDDAQTHAAIAEGLAAALNVASQTATGTALGITSKDGVVYVGGNSNSVSLTTAVSVSSTSGTASANDSATPIAEAARYVNINVDDAVEGNKFILTIGDKSYSVVAGYGVSSTAIRNTVADDLAALLAVDYSGSGVIDHVDNASASANDTGQIAISAAAGLGLADISLRVVRMADGAAVETQTSEVSDPSLTSSTADRTITLSDFDIIEGRKATVRIGNPDFYTEFSTVVGASDTKTTVADRLADLINATHGGTADSSGVITITGSTANLGMSHISLTFNDMVEGAAVTQSSTVTGKNLANADRTITINQSDLSPGNVVSVNIGDQEYAVKVRDGELAADVAYRLGQLIDDDYARTAGTLTAPTFVTTAGTNATAETASVVFSSAAQTETVIMGGLTLTVTDAGGMSATEVATAFASRAAGYSAADGAKYTFSGTLTGWSTAAVSGGSSDTVVFTSSTYGNVTNLTDTGNAGTAITTTAGVDAVAESSVATFTTGMAEGDSLTLAGLTFTATRTVTKAELIAAFAGLSAGATDGGGSSYGKYTGALTGWSTGSATATGFTATNTSAISGVSDTDVSVANIDLGIVATRVDSGITVSSNVITLNKGSGLGLEDISVTVKTITNPGRVTLTAGADTGLGGTSQSVDIGTIAAGGSKTLNFDQLGVKFNLDNARTTAVNSDSFGTFTSKVNSLQVESAGDGEALFQVGANTRDTVVMNGFKDIRVNGYNNNSSAAEREVFDNLSAQLDLIAQNTTESLSEANFATLENQIEDAITTVSDFRSYLGAQQNRIEYAIANIQAQSENLTAANSRIVDTDYAAETANLTKTQIMQQAATAMLAQANQMPNVILALLK